MDTDLSELTTIIDPEAEAEDGDEDDVELTRAGEVWVSQCIWDHADGSCAGSAKGDPCGTEDRAHRLLVRVDPPYTHRDLRAIVRARWGKWWKKSGGSQV